MDKTPFLLDDLHDTIDYVDKGIASISSYAHENNGIVWEIKGLKKNLVVMLHYQNVWKGENGINGTDLIDIKQEPQDSAMMCFEIECSPDIFCTDDAAVVVGNRISDSDDSTCQSTKDYTSQSTTCDNTSNKEQLSQNTGSEQGSAKKLQIELNDTNTNHIDDESIAGDREMVNLKNGFALLEPLEMNDFEINKLAGVQDPGSFSIAGHEISDVTNGSGLKCAKCGFNIKDNLGSLNQVQAMDNMQLCLRCEKTDMKFTLQPSLEKQKLIPSGEKPFECSYCGKILSCQYDLHEHKLIHTRLKPYKCSQCNKKFFKESNLKAHEASHSALKPYKCLHCDKSFSCESSLRHHNFIHDGVFYECLQCGRAFSNKYVLNRHKGIHSRNNHFKCTLCNQTFDLKRDLALHKLTHSGRNPFECSQCNKKFSRKSHLKRHEVKHAGVEPCESA